MVNDYVLEVKNLRKIYKSRVKNDNDILAVNDISFGICKGEILNEKRGKSGFGYDPIFKPCTANKSFAEMNMNEKANISHRGKAIDKLVLFLNKYTC